MFTPKEIHERTFVKAVFGGYDMKCVDDFLEPLSEDYISLFKENAVLKSKMKILVEKLEEYRAQEETMKKALFAAQKASDAIVAEAEEKCATMRTDVEKSMKNQMADVQGQIDAEKDRVDRAKVAATNFIEIIEKDVSQHLTLLSNLKLMNLASTAKSQVYDFDKEALVTKNSKTQSPTSKKPVASPIKITDNAIDNDTDKTANAVAEIEQNVERILGNATIKNLDDTQVASSSNKFADLQFGKNYDYKNKK